MGVLDDVRGVLARAAGALGLGVAPARGELGRAGIGDLPIWQQFSRIGGGLTPERLSSYLRNADAGYPYQLIEIGKESRQKDGHLHGILQTRELAIQGLPWECYFPGQEPDSTRGTRQKKFIDESLRDNAEFHGLIAHLSGGFFPGFAVSETIWGLDSKDRQVPRAFKTVDERRFGFARSDGRLIFRDLPTSTQEIDLASDFAPGKLVVSQPRIVGDVPCREGLIRVLTWAALFRNWTLADWLKLGELSWKPHRIGKYKKGANASKKDIDDLFAILRGLTSSGVAAVPDTVDLEVFWPGGTAGNSGSGQHERLFSVIGREMSKATLGQDGTTEQTSTSGYAQANVLDRVRGDVLASDARHIAMVITRDVIVPMIAMNFGTTAPVPYFRFILDDGEDLAAFSLATKNFVQAGLRVPARWVRNRVGMPAPQPDEEVLGEELEDDTNGEPDAGPDPKDPNEAPAGDGAAENDKAA